MTDAYTALEQRFARLTALAGSLAVLQWDTRTMMPAGAADGRAEQIAAMDVTRHELLTSLDVGEWLAEAQADTAALSSWQRANLREMAWTYDHAMAVPADLVEAHSRACTRCETAWGPARATGDFKALQPLLQDVLHREREVAAAKAARLGCNPYDALLDGYEPGLRASLIDPLFAELETFLPSFLAQVMDEQAARRSGSVPGGPFPVERQRAVAERLIGTLGFDFSRGRLDESLHPFCAGTAFDTRLTTRYDEANVAPALMAVLHETGHGLYEQGLPSDWAHQPVGASRGMVVHESQSLLIEMQACRSRPFIGHLARVLDDGFGDADVAWDADALYDAYTRVEPGFIRVDADEVTYPAHILLRWRLEQALLSDDLVLADLPVAWNDGMRDLLGIVPPDDRLGCLQDIHWPSGAWGYFPTYTLGAIMAAQLFATVCRDVPEVPDHLARGDFGPLLAWLRRHIHGQASRLLTRELLIEATGRPLQLQPYLDHLHGRYLGWSA